MEFQNSNVVSAGELTSNSTSSGNGVNNLQMTATILHYVFLKCSEFYYNSTRFPGIHL